MKIDVLTLFPEMFDALNCSLMGRAKEKGLYELHCHNIRDYSADKHKKCDDTPFGGGAGMVMTPQPIHDCIGAVDPEHKALRIYMSPRGMRLNQQIVKDLSQCGDIVILCGHYEGVDQRVIDMDIDMELSVGDYVLSGGELPQWFRDYRCHCSPHSILRRRESRKPSPRDTCRRWDLQALYIDSRSAASGCVVLLSRTRLARWLT